MEGVVVEGLEKGDMEESPKTIQPVLGKQKVKPSVVLRSPYFNRKITLAPTLSNSKFVISMELFSMIGDST